ncbi:MAG: cyclopropane fatty acyl phospholipid synthase [Patescibacteria group bacterium]
MKTTQTSLSSLLSEIDVQFNGSRPTDVTINDERAYKAIASGGTLAIGKAFMDNWWECEDLASLVARVYLDGDFERKIVAYDEWPLLIKGLFFNLQSRARAYMVAHDHYDIGNDLYQAMLDERMVYTSAMWSGVTTLEAAQEQKLEALCQKMGLKAGDRILDIGCGWGSLMQFAAERYGVMCVGLTVSKEQKALGEERCQGLPVEFVLTDYREYVDETGFDHIVSVEMLEAVGPKNFKTYFNKVHELLKPGGRFVLQTIGLQTPARPAGDLWIDRYIFPNGILPSLSQLESHTRKLFTWEHLENIGPDYDPTLMAWWERFDKAYGELSQRNPKYDQRFYRMWKFYLQSCAGLFRARAVQDWQIVFRKPAS